MKNMQKPEQSIPEAPSRFGQLPLAPLLIVTLFMVSLVFPSIFLKNRGGDFRGAIATRKMPFVILEDGTFSVRNAGVSAKMQTGAVVYALAEKDGPASVVTELMPSNATPQGGEISPTTVNYLIGSDQNNWRTGIPAYGSVKYPNVWPGIDVSFNTRGGAIEKVVTVNPGANLKQANFLVEGALISAQEDGSLLLHTKGQDATLSKPVAYQMINGKRHDVSVAYTLGFNSVSGVDNSANTAIVFKSVKGSGKTSNSVNLNNATSYGFSVGEYNPSYTLVIDPLLAGTVIGSTDYEDGASIARDPATGDIYITGDTYGTDFPATSGATQESSAGSYDIVVAKFSSDLATLQSATYLGGSGDDWPTTMSFHDGSIYISGQTSSDVDFPIIAGAYQTSAALDAAGSTSYVSKLSADLSTLESSTYLNGLHPEEMVVDTTRGVYVAGFICCDSSSPFQTTPGAYQTTFVGGWNGAVANLSLDLTALQAATLLAGTSTCCDSIESIALVPDGLYVAGTTASSDFPTTPGAYQTVNPGTSSFVSKLSSDLQSLQLSTFINGSSYVGGLAINSGDVYVTAYASEPNLLETTPGSYRTTPYTLASDFATGKVGSGFLMDRISLGSSVGFYENLGGTITDQFTLDAWVNHTSTDNLGYQRYVSLQGADWMVGPESAIRLDGDHVAFFVWTTNGLKYLTDPSVVTYNTFNHVTGVFNGAAGTMELYVNGALVASTTVPPGTSMGSKLDATPGSPTVGLIGIIEAMNGVIDEPEIFNRALTSGEVNAIYSADSAGKCKPSAVPGCTPPPSDMINWWPGDDNFMDQITAIEATHVFTPFPQSHISRFSADLGTLQASTFFPCCISNSNTLGSDGLYLIGYNDNGATVAPTSGAFQETTDNPYPGFVSKISYDLSTLMKSTYLGGGATSGGDYPMSALLDSSGNIFVTGTTYSEDFPTTVGAYDCTGNGTPTESGDIFIAKLDSDLSSGGSTPCTNSDDNDGIDEAIDTEPGVASLDFTDGPAVNGLTSATSGGATFGTIVDYGGLTLNIVDLPSPDGVRISASGSGSFAIINLCSEQFELWLSSGDVVDITCGSVFATAVSTDDDIQIKSPIKRGKAAIMYLTEGQKAKMTSTSNSVTITADPANSSQVAVGVENSTTHEVFMTTDLDSSEAVTFTFDSKGGVKYTVVSGAITVVSDGTSINLSAGQSYTDHCPGLAGNVGGTGCPYADKTNVTLHIVDQQKSGVCGLDNKGKVKTQCDQPVSGALVKIFDRENTDFITAYGSKRPKKQDLDLIYESDVALVSDCTTDANGSCTAMDDHPGKFLVIVKMVDGTKSVYDGKFKNFKKKVITANQQEEDDEDVDGLTAKDVMLTKNMHIIKTIKKNGSVSYSAGYMTVITGSELDIIAPAYTVWGGISELYPLIMTSKEDWTVDVCMQIPTGYKVSAVEDGEGNILPTSECSQAFVAGEPKVVLFTVTEVGSPEPVFNLNFTVKHNGKTTKVKRVVEGVRINSKSKTNGEIRTRVEQIKKNQATVEQKESQLKADKVKKSKKVNEVRPAQPRSKPTKKAPAKTPISALQQAKSNMRR